MNDARVETLLSEVCTLHGVTRGELMQRNHAFRVSWARQHAMVRMMEEAGMSRREVCRFFDCQDAQVLHAAKAIARRRDTNTPFVFKNRVGQDAVERARMSAPRLFRQVWLQVFQPKRSRKEVGAILGITPQRVEQIEAVALWKVLMRMKTITGGR